MSPDSIGVLSPYLVEQCRVILDSEPALVRGVQAGGPDETGELVEVVHDVRVAIRRLRSTIRTFAPAFDDDERRLLIDEGAWYAGELGELRDLDVIGDRLAHWLDALDPAVVIGPVASLITDDLTSQRVARRRQIADTLRTERYAALRAHLQRWAEQPAWSEDAGDVDLLARVAKAKKRVRRRRKAAKIAIGENAPEALHLMHQARKAAKRHRYAVELAAPLIGERAESIIAKRKRQQDELGLVQDSVVTVQYLIGLAQRYGNRSGRNAFTLGVLAAAEQAEQRDAERFFSGLPTSTTVP